MMLKIGKSTMIFHMQWDSMIIIMVDDACSTIYGWSMDGDVDDAIAHDLHPCEERLGK